MKKKYLYICLLLACALLFAACGGPGTVSETPEKKTHCTITYLSRMPSETETTTSTKTVLRGEMAQDVSLPGNEVYVLEGWYHNGEKWDFDAAPVTEDITLEANWVHREYTVQYCIDGAVRMATAVYYGETTGDPYVEMHDRLTASADWKKKIEDGYIFVGWTKDGVLWNFEEDVVTADIKLEARFVPAGEIDQDGKGAA